MYVPSSLVMSSWAEHQGIIPEKYLISWTSLKLKLLLREKQCQECEKTSYRLEKIIAKDT